MSPIIAAVMLVASGPGIVPPMLEPAFTATIVSSFTSMGRSHDASAGRWNIKGDAICLHQVKPFPIPFAAYCTPVPTGDTAQGWPAKAITGEPITLRITPGR